MHPAVSLMLTLCLVVHVTEGKSILERIVKRSTAFVAFNGQRVFPLTTRVEAVPNYGMSNTAGATRVADFNSTQIQPQALTPATQLVSPGTLLTTNNVFGSQTFPRAVIPTYGANTLSQVVGYPYQVPQVPVYNFAPPQVLPHSHTPVQVPPHTHDPIQDPGPGIVVIQVPVPQIVRVPSNASTAPAVPPQSDLSVSAILALLQALPNTPIPQTVRAGGSSSSD